MRQFTLQQVQDLRKEALVKKNKKKEEEVPEGFVPDLPTTAVMKEQKEEVPEGFVPDLPTGNDVKPEERGPIGKAWDWLNKGLVRPEYVELMHTVMDPNYQRYMKMVDTLAPGIPKIIQEFESGMTSPLNVALGGVAGLEYGAAKLGAAGVAGALNLGQKAISYPFAYQGLHTAVPEVFGDKMPDTPYPMLTRGMGAVQAVLGALGTRSKTPEINTQGRFYSASPKSTPVPTFTPKAVSHPYIAQLDKAQAANPFLYRKAVYGLVKPEKMTREQFVEILTNDRKLKQPDRAELLKRFDASQIEPQNTLELEQKKKLEFFGGKLDTGEVPEGFVPDKPSVLEAIPGLLEKIRAARVKNPAMSVHDAIDTVRRQEATTESVTKPIEEPITEPTIKAPEAEEILPEYASFNDAFAQIKKNYKGMSDETAKRITQQLIDANRIKIKAEAKPELSNIDMPEGPSFSRAPHDVPAKMELPGNRIAMQASDRLTDIIASAHEDSIGRELLQNATDAARFAPGGRGKVIINITPERMIISDNGPGVSRNALGKEFIDIGESGKTAGGQGGEYGIGKTAYYKKTKSLKTTTLVNDPGSPYNSAGMYEHSFGGSPKDFTTAGGGVEVKSKRVGGFFSTPSTGTTMEAEFARPLNDHEMGEFIDSLHKKIENSTHEENIQIEMTHPKMDFLKRNQNAPWDSNTNPFEYKIIPGKTEKYSQNLSERRANSNISTISTPFADIELLVEKGAKLSDNRPYLEISNNGYHQITDVMEKKGHNVPNSVHINIKPKVPATDANYPVDLARNSLRPDIRKAIIKLVNDNVIDPSWEGSKAHLQKLWNTMPSVRVATKRGDTKFYIHDETQLLTPEMMQRMQSDPDWQRYMANVVETIGDVNDSLKGTEFTDSGARTARIGFLIEHPNKKYKGVNIPNLTLPEGAPKEYAVMVNPFAHVKSPDSASTGLLATLYHEIGHNYTRGEDASHLWTINRIEEIFGGKRSIAAIGRFIETLEEPTSGNFKRPYVELLQGVEARTPIEPAKEFSLRSTGTSSEGPAYSRAGEDGTPENVGRDKAVSKLLIALHEAKKLVGEQKEIYRLERAKRIAKANAITDKGQSGYYKQLGALKGEFAKVRSEPLKLAQEDVDKLFAIIHDSKLGYDRINAKTALAKMLDGRVPTESEQKLLKQVFPPELMELFGGLGGVPIKLTSEMVNLPRSLMASTDVSAPFRQGIGLMHTKQFWKNIPEMLKAFGSERYYTQIDDVIKSNQYYELARHAGIKFTNITDDYIFREETFMSRSAEKLFPPVRWSERAYVGFLNKLRMDTFENLYKLAQDEGHMPEQNYKLLSELASYINAASGRGDLGRLENSAVNLNSVFFSPRLIASRVQMLNPTNYISTNPFVRKQYWKSLFTILTGGTMFANLTAAAFKAMGKDVDISTDIYSADFGKVKIGNTRLDPYGGFQQYVVFLARLAAGKQTSSSTGKTIDLTSRRYRSLERFDVTTRFLESKANPIASLVATWLHGKDYRGMPIDYKNEIMARVVPMMIQDLQDLYKTDPDLFILAIPAALGAGLQTYTPPHEGSLRIIGGDYRGGVK